MIRRLAPLAALVVVLAGCGGSGGGSAGSGNGGSIVLYNGQHPELTQALVKAFEQKSGIDVKMRTNDSIVLANQILNEGRSPADVFIAENSPELMTLEEKGLLARLKPSTLSQVPRAVSSPAGDWVGMALRVSSLAYDPGKLGSQPLPKSVLDLAKPEWKGKVGISPTDSDFPPLVGAVMAAYGSKAAAAWLEGLKQNAKTYADEEAVVAAVNRGDVATGIVNQYYWYRLRLELGKNAMHSRLYYFPNRNVGSITNVSGAAVLDSSSHKGEAEQFVRFLVSPQAQKIIAASDDFEYPARTDVPPNPALPSLASIAHASLGMKALGTHKQAAALIQSTGLI
jgi:iron(III) transport system substrate-binding protein